MLDFERSPGRCPSCGRECPKHDHRERTWRDLDFCWDQFLHALVPRVDCAEHGVVTVAVTWSARRSEFTESFERITIALIREMSVAAVSRRMAVSWDQVDVVMMRAVERGRTRQQPRLVKNIGIDEKAIKKGHRYFTLVFDLDASVVLFVGHGRKRATIDISWAGLSRGQLAAVEGVAMDMATVFRFNDGLCSRRSEQDRLRSFSRDGISYEGRRSHAPYAVR